jgi:hypothetical protein
MVLALLAPLLGEKSRKKKLFLCALCLGGLMLTTSFWKKGFVWDISFLCALFAGVLHGAMVVCNKKLLDISSYDKTLLQLAATAAVLVLLITCSVTAKAFGIDVWKAVIQWTQETFHFGEWGNSNPDNNLQFESLQEALEESNISISLVPTWIPDGYKLVRIIVQRNPMQKIYRAQYASGESELIITVREYLEDKPLYVEQSEGLIEKYEINGITYYLIENNKEIRAVWIVDSFECSIAGLVKIEEMKTMIDSITKG